MKSSRFSIPFGFPEAVLLVLFIWPAAPAAMAQGTPYDRIPLTGDQQPFAHARQLSDREIKRRASETVIAPATAIVPRDEAASTPVLRDGSSARTEANLPPSGSDSRLNAGQESARLTPVRNPSWQQRYTLGPGDSLNFSMYERPDLSRPAVPVAPDGTISYLQAVGVQARGKTISELREAIETALSEYHRNPKLIVTPGKIGSKNFTIIGRVRQPGSYGLSRPTTILEGIATAQGIEVGTVGGSSFELADFEHSFVARHGRKLDVDLSKLYYEGDFEQNAYLEPNDYIFVASSLRNEFYVIGAVRNPGRRKMASRSLTVTRAIVEAGGFDGKAHKQGVLLVRGSIHNPETHVIKVRDVLEGRTPDMKIQNRDIIFVSKRPLELAERALDSAIFTFVQTIIAEAVNDEFLTIPAQ